MELFGELLGEIAGIIAAVLLIVGALECYLGYKIFKIQIAIAGFLAGAALGAFAGASAADHFGVAIVAAVIAGIIIAVLAVKLYFVGVFIYVGALSFILGYLLSKDLTLSIVLGVILGIAGAFAARHIIIITSSVSGGLMAGNGFCALVGIESKGLMMVFSAAFIVTGLLVQYMTNKTNKAKSPQPAAVQAAPVSPESEPEK